MAPAIVEIVNMFKTATAAATTKSHLHRNARYSSVKSNQKHTH